MDSDSLKRSYQDKGRMLPMVENQDSKIAVKFSGLQYSRTWERFYLVSGRKIQFY